jgi:hypothetical protein
MQLAQWLFTTNLFYRGRCAGGPGALRVSGRRFRVSLGLPLSHDRAARPLEEDVSRWHLEIEQSHIKEPLGAKLALQVSEDQLVLAFPEAIASHDRVSFRPLSHCIQARRKSLHTKEIGTHRVG